MKTSLIALALLVGASVNVEAQTAANTGSPPAAEPVASARPAASKAGAAKHAAAPGKKTQAQKSDQPADLSRLVPKDSALKELSTQQQQEQQRQNSHRIDSRGVDCSIYPARCKD